MTPETLHVPYRRPFLRRLLGGFAAGVFLIPSLTACSNWLPQPSDSSPKPSPTFKTGPTPNTTVTIPETAAPSPTPNISPNTTPSGTPTPTANPTEVPDGIYRGHAKEHIKTVLKSDIEAQLGMLAIDPGGPKPPYQRKLFGEGWEEEKDCDTRDELLIRDLSNEVVGPKCEVLSGKLYDPYSLTETDFVKSVDPSRVQAEHRIADKVAWYAGLYKWKGKKEGPQKLKEFYNDHKNLEIVKGTVNQDKGDDPIDEWVPTNPDYICSFTAMYIDVKEDWDLTITQKELAAMKEHLANCGYAIPVIE